MEYNTQCAAEHIYKQKYIQYIIVINNKSHQSVYLVKSYKALNSNFLTQKYRLTKYMCHVGHEPIN
jgi:hypothetical protein